MSYHQHFLGSYHTYTLIDPEATENQRAFNMTFVSQWEIRKKIEKTGEFRGKVLSDVVEITSQVYNHTDTLENRQTRKLATIMMAAYQREGSQKSDEE